MPNASTAPDPGTQQSLLWALGGGALVLLGLGGAALARRRRDVTVDEGRPVADALAQEPAVMHRPVVSAATYVAPRSTRDPHVARNTSYAAEGDSLEAMVAAPPSADNPFTTRTKRLRRAKFLLAQQAASQGPERNVAPQTTHAEPVAATATDRSQTVYRFGAAPNRQGFLKPRPR